MQSVPVVYHNPEAHRRLIVNALRELADGRVNSNGDVTLTESVASSAITDPRVGPDSVILFMPTTANAAAEQAAGTMYVSSRGDGTYTVTHANNGQTDRTFAVVVLGS